MSGKLYPDEVIRKQVNTGVWAHTWKGSVSTLLLQEEAEALYSILEGLFGREDVSDELGNDIENLQDEICQIVRNGRARMGMLHSVLGGYDLGEGGAISKPESERIEWPAGAFSINPGLELVKGGGKEKDDG